MRNLFRVAAIIDEKQLHRVLIFFADIKAMNVDTQAVTAGPSAAPADHPEPAAPPAAPANAREAVLQSIHASRTGVVTSQEVQGAWPQWTRGAIQQAMFKLVADKTIKRIRPGVFRNGKMPAAPVLTRGPVADVVFALLADAPERTMTISEMLDGAKTKGLRKMDGRLMRGFVKRNADALKRVGRGRYQLKG